MVDQSSQSVLYCGRNLFANHAMAIQDREKVAVRQIIDFGLDYVSVLILLLREECIHPHFSSVAVLEQGIRDLRHFFSVLDHFVNSLL